ncbi:hypothetical protein FA95DRAFT_1344797 [Auriscalpium vulgare]|uniref:Uncharacterized protein n=1 Tax=Auriscalpium vulgare TaxID=40419 RepID=A0ACB8R1L8_9AGAM|nr:hypothetical protein FA95DRAFT_1344797 [Auriscalpium vulgare]
MATPIVRHRALEKFLTPAVGVYIAISLDPEATVRHLQDPVATREAEALTRSVYIGYVSSLVDSPSPDRAYHLCDFHILSQGLPVSAAPSDGLDETMCVAVSPSEHPDGRNPVSPQPPLPWTNLFHHTTPDIRIRLRSQPGDYRGCSMLSRKDMFSISQWAVADGMRRGDAINNYFADHPDHPDAQTRLQVTPEEQGIPRLSPYLITPGYSSSDISGIRSPSSSGTSSSSTTSSTSPDCDIDGSLTSVYDVGALSASDVSTASASDVKLRPLQGDIHYHPPFIQNVFGYDDPYDRFIPLATFSKDISPDLKFSSADSFLAEARELRRIMVEWEERRINGHQLDCSESGICGGFRVFMRPSHLQVMSDAVTSATVEPVPDAVAPVAEDSHGSHEVLPTEADQSMLEVALIPSPEHPKRGKLVSAAHLSGP